MSSQTTDRRQRVDASTTGVIDAAIDRPGELSGLRSSQSEELQEDRETLVELLHQMILIRRFEEKSAESYSLGKIGGFCHLYIGQEAVGVGAISAVRRDDYVITSYREHGQAIAKGIPVEAVMAELFGKSGGCSRGKGG